MVDVMVIYFISCILLYILLCYIEMNYNGVISRKLFLLFFVLSLTGPFGLLFLLLFILYIVLTE